MHRDNTNVFASNIIDKYENRLDNLHLMCLKSHHLMSPKRHDLPIEPNEIKSYAVPVSNIDDVKLSPNMIVLKNELGEMWKRSRLCIICFHKVFKLTSPEDHYLRLLQLYMPWRNKNELKQDNKSYEDR